MTVHALTHAGRLAHSRTTFCGLQVHRLIDRKGWATRISKKRIAKAPTCKKCAKAMPRLKDAA